MKRRYSWPLKALLILALLLITAQLALPWLIRDYLNDKLADMGDYRGHIGDIDLAWWRGAYRINDPVSYTHLVKPLISTKASLQ